MILLTVSSCASTTNPNENSEETKTKLAEINIQLGMAYLGQQDVQRAKQKLFLALEENPQLPETWYSLAYFEESTGNQILARKYYLKAVELAPERGDVQNNFGTYLCRSGHYQEAIQHFETAVQDIHYLDTAAAYENAGLCSLKIPDKKAAKQYFKLALEQDPKREASAKELAKLG